MSQKTVETMKQWIADNITSEIRLEQVAAHVGYSPYYCSVKFHEAFLRAFRKSYGMAPSRYRSTYMEMESDVYEDDEQH